MSLHWNFSVPIVISAIALILIIFYRRVIFDKDRYQRFWVSIIAFFTLYLIIIVGAYWTGVNAHNNLAQFDLDGDGSFSGVEITDDLNAALKKVSKDTARQFAFVTGAFMAGFTAIIVYLIQLLVDKIRVSK